MTRRRRRGRVLRWIALLALVAWTAGFLLFVHAIPGPASQATRHADAIVVPTGGGERLPAGIALLQAGVADRMFVSGVHSGVDVATILDLNSQAPTTLACCIELGHNADHSVGNARETATWMASAGRKSMYLVDREFPYAAQPHAVPPVDARGRDHSLAGRAGHRAARYLVGAIRARWRFSRPSTPSTS